MELSTIKTLLELAGGPAFAMKDGVICVSDPEATALGVCSGVPFSALIPNVSLPVPNSTAIEQPILLNGQSWTLRAAATADWILCFLRRTPHQAPAPNESTLLHTAGSIRLALQDLIVALNALADTVSDDPDGTRQAALALRSIFRLRRTAGDLELLASLRAGSFRLNRQSCRPVAAVATLCMDLDELLRPIGRSLHFELPNREISCCLDWDLTSALLRELIANAAADTVDGKIHLTMSRLGTDRLCFSIRNTPGAPLPESPFHRHAAEQSDLARGAGLGLSLVSAGAEYHGGGLMLSTANDGTVTALLTLRTAESSDTIIRSTLQLPLDPNTNLIAFSQLLPVDFFLPEDLL